MQKFVLTAFALALFVFGASPVAAQMTPAEMEEVEIQATVVDISCKLVYNVGGEDHRQCAQACADAGIPLGLMTDDGKIYMPVTLAMASSPFGNLRAHAEHRVTVKGKVFERAGMNAIVIDEVSMQ